MQIPFLSRQKKMQSVICLLKNRRLLLCTAVFKKSGVTFHDFSFHSDSLEGEYEILYIDDSICMYDRCTYVYLKRSIVHGI